MANVSVFSEIPSFPSNYFYFREKKLSHASVYLEGEGKGLEEKE